MKIFFGHLRYQLLKIYMSHQSTDLGSSGPFFLESYKEAFHSNCLGEIFYPGKLEGERRKRRFFWTQSIKMYRYFLQKIIKFYSIMQQTFEERVSITPCSSSFIFNCHSFIFIFCGNWYSFFSNFADYLLPPYLKSESLCLRKTRQRCSQVQAVSHH